VKKCSKQTKKIGGGGRGGALVSAEINLFVLTLILLTSTKWRAPASASKWQMGFNSAFKGLIRQGLSLTSAQMARIQYLGGSKLSEVMWAAKQRNKRI
jgi:hypothetical protein